MGLFTRTKDKAIQQKIQKLSAKERRVLKLLLLGSGDSGKTTIFKQFKILYGIHKAGVDERSRSAMRNPLFGNVISGAKALLAGIEELQEQGLTQPLDNPNALAAKDVIDALDHRHNEMSPEIAGAIETLVKDEKFLLAWKNRSKLQVLDSWLEIASNCEDYPQWGGPEWIPSEKEYLLTRVRTTGVIQETFNLDNARIQLVDVGGQRNERKKWIHCFGGVTGVLYVAAASEYDQPLFEDKSRNRLVEALGLFGSVANTATFKETTMILFLNKSDIFRDKLCVRKIPLNVSGEFPDAPDTFDYDAGVQWLQNKFIEQSNGANKLVYAHVTTATDKSNIGVVIDAVRTTVLKEALENLRFT
mmetsp:Transcript_5207/g.6046  ORF Transcript_5207/g.6046 Transcript_5207/m.6046 type:complete len:360 (-) Transcript_5207:797-1876(-)|eukprot:CAMPEP_0184016884 /NCGR_PEP_ID=MMETSP0954-20121128/7188_1 /TAXON_ID=627963 /ORGANISM="Aplanochytrium sp, Strain PBS07" /LENGTH=359 /DNA_ID=CAMNT_0026297977 /DNA_START=441 /DNA_END=1520 /DNA_ORIENTATION=-